MRERGFERFFLKASDFDLKQSFFTDPCSLSSPVQLRDPQQHLCRQVFVHYPEHDGRRRGEEEVEEDHQPVVDHGGSREAAEELIPEQEVDIGLGEEAE